MIWKIQVMENDTRLDLIFRVLALLVVLAMTVIMLGLSANLAYAKQAKPKKDEFAISGKHIRLKHVFKHTGDKGEKVLGPAPKPGEEMVLDARTLYRVARTFNLGWQPETMAEQLVLTRNASLVEPATIREALKDKIGQNNAYKELKIQFIDEAPEIILPPDAEKSLHVADLRLNTARDTFRAKLVAPSADNPVVTKRIRGEIERMSEIPVLKRSMRNGDIIKKRHFNMLEIPAADINGKMLVNAGDITGMTPRNIVRAGKPVRDGQLTKPRLVKRGEKVTIRYSQGPLRLTAKGKALESGAKGDIVRTVNLDSNQTLDAHVKGDKQVRVY